MTKTTIALVCFIVAVILAVVAAAMPPYSGRLLAVAVAFVALGLAVEAS